IVSAATDSTEARILDADRSNSQPVLFLARQDAHEYYVTDGEDCYVVLSNAHGENFSVFETPIDRTAREAWTEILAPRESVLLTGLDVFSRYIVISSVESGLDRIEIIDRRSRARRTIDVPDPVCSAYTHDNLRYRSPQLRFSYESMVTPESTYDVDMATGEKILLRRAKVAGEFDASQYATERILVQARDGKRIPVSLAYRKDRPKERTAPLLLHAYGAYGISSEPTFDSDLVSLLDRGFVYGIAHVRGGSECGRAWYYDGRQFAKQNTFNDFIDVTRYLIESDYTAADRCYASGGSAGGLLMGAVANTAPELYHGIVAHVPFVDVLTTMLDESIPLTTGEYAEWGDPRQESAYRYMATYSPYDNVAAQDYPHMLVTAGLHDSQVQYWEPAKWVAKLRGEAASTGTLLLHTDMGAGHSGKTGRYKALEDTALEFTFLLMLEAQRRRDAATV
ncbi:MAG: prolyl oligopeptidase family serine peptidase, partial [Pseudomonadota bacterium]